MTQTQHDRRGRRAFATEVLEGFPGDIEGLCRGDEERVRWLRRIAIAAEWGLLVAQCNDELTRIETDDTLVMAGKQKHQYDRASSWLKRSPRFHRKMRADPRELMRAAPFGPIVSQFIQVFSGRRR